VFDGETRARARHFSPRKPHGWVPYEGYPYRYFRFADGDLAVIISDGPDLHADLTDKELLNLEAGLKHGQPHFEVLASYTYDPTNGTYSGGDVWRVFAE